MLTENGKQGLVPLQTWTPEALEACEELLNLCNVYEGLDIKLSLTMLQSRSGQETNDFLYYENGELVGVLSLDNYGEQDREISGMVHPGYRRRGICTLLLEAAKAECKQRGIERLVIVCERFSRSGQAYLETLDAEYDYSENRMELKELQLREQSADDLVVRPAHQDDLDALARVRALSFGEVEERTRQHLEEDIREPQRQYYLATVNGEPAGMLNTWDDAHEIGLYAVGIIPTYRRRGYGRAMLEQVIQRIQAQTAKRITLEVETNNTKAIALYHACGFVETTTYGYYNLDIY